MHLCQSNSTVRLFLACWPSRAVASALADWQRAWHWPDRARLTDVARLHLTLHFIGPVAVHHIEALRTALRVRFEPFEVPLRDACAQVWPGGIAVLELQAPPALRRLHAALAEALRAQDLPVETRGFRPHVTFARKATGALPPPCSPDLDWRVDDGYSLVRSAGGRYDVLHHHGPHG